jgi:5-methylcytosine-specific restriction endonuclease McrA
MTDWDRDDAGHPLWRVGVTGAPLRQDGDSHLEGWARVIRLDSCSYCDCRGGSVDHIIPQRPRVAGVHVWHNYAGACTDCNESKGDEKMIVWLARRHIIRRTQRGRSQ